MTNAFHCFVLALVLGASSLYGADPVLQRLFTNQAAAGVSTLIIRNRGQVQHVVTVRLEDAPSQTCAGGFVNLYLEGSDDDGATWKTIGAPLTVINANQYGQFVGRVEAQHIRQSVRFTIGAAGFDTTNCRLYADYAGSFEPLTSTPLPLVVKVLTLADGVVNGELFSTPVNPAGRNTHRFFADTAGCVAYGLGAQIQVGYSSAGPWESRGFNTNFADANPVVLGPTLFGSFPLVRLYVPSGSTANSCDLEIYYYGTNESAVTPDVGNPIQLVTVGVTASNSVEILPASSLSESNWVIRGLFLDQPCAAGTVTLSGSVVGGIIATGPASHLEWPLLNGAQEHAVLANQDLDLVGAALTASCTANLTLWVSQRFIP